MTLPNRPNYTPGGKRRERKYQVDDTSAALHAGNVVTAGKGHVRATSNGAELHHELMQVLAGVGPNSEASQEAMNLASTEGRVKELATLKAQTEAAQQRLLSDPTLQKLSNNDDLLSLAGVAAGASQSDPLEQVVSGMASSSGIPFVPTSKPGNRNVTNLDPQWIALFQQATPERQTLIDALGKLDNTDVSQMPELNAAMNMLPDAPLRGKYQRAANGAHEWGKQHLYHQLRLSTSNRGTFIRSAPSSPIDSPLRTPPKKRTNLSKHAKAVLRAWFEEHLHHPYPTEDEKDWLALQGGITIEQVNNWFINTRGRKWKPMLTRLMAQKQAGGDCKLYDQMVEKIAQPYRRSPSQQ
ncbi:hypothetical protein Poli38472_000352 [Pythium oligandrum]|uniref:Homeobox domain-containing protein n=1 Tax=Pythium oligandrum TaxID=41045 RepID=A0A8K1CBY8_PYTOL|nr:hypothetical protein Poli38472_000352 [Pythium oligandrum]|eukprot:TMW60310.1 hypothetical protein Poli38472_000352 [Pythium oligandrum]